ncbi:PAS domain S-box protein [Terrimonas pollutisoli]|uniref:PAS domain S-box protein n=1 Tax=Terrimonas pollutisoli TaxID=3034147 RepID=UPI0023EE0054|nr:PAS domain S-box protein [Terrimonas sp. H1YJ31]
MNKILQRQLHQYFGELEKVPAGLTGLFNLISDSYDWFEKELETPDHYNGPSKKTVDLNGKRKGEKEEILPEYFRELETLFKNIEEVVFSIDMQHHRLLLISPSCESVCGYSQEDFYQNPGLWLDIIVKEDKVAIIKANHLLREGQLWDGEYRITPKNKAAKWVETKLKPTLDHNGKLLRIDGVTADITSRKQTEERLRQNEERLRAILNNEPECVKVVDISGLLQEMNPAGLKMIDAETEDQVRGNEVIGLIHPDDKEVYLQLHRRVCEGETGTANFRVISLKKKEMWMETHSVPLRNPDGKIYAVLSVTRDITEKRKAEEVSEKKNNELIAIKDELERSERSLKQAQAMAHLGSWEADFDTSESKWSDEMYAIFGVKKDDIAASLDAFLSFVHPDDLENVTAAIRKGEQTLEDYSYSCSIIRRDEVIRHIHADYRYILNPDGKPVQLQGIVHDITDRHGAEEKFKALLEAAPDAMIIANEKGRIVLVNHQTEVLFGYKKDELINKPVEILVPQEFRNKHEGHRGHYHKEPRTRSMGAGLELFAVCKDGTRLPVEISLSPLKTADGILISAAIRDITERKGAEAKLRHNEARLKQAQSIGQMGHWEVNFITNTSAWSDEAYRIYGIEPGDRPLSYKDWLSYIHPGDVDHVLNEINKSQETLSDSSVYHRIVRKDGVVRHVLSEGKYEFDAGDRPVGVYGIVHDVTERKRNEQELRNLNEQLQKRAEELVASNAELERFAYVASHDLQEPLRMISSFLQLLQKKYNKQLDETAGQYISYAVDGAERMKRLILDLLEYSRVGTSRDQFTDTDINEVVGQVLETFNNKIQQTGALVKVHAMPVVKAVRIQMVQLFQNLVSNSLKYNTSPAPEIEIGCEKKDGAWQFFVKDNGIGIDQKYFEKVFAIFQRLHNKNQFSGTGIGLAICKKIAEKHGGNIWVASCPGNGSTFFFTINNELYA